MVICISFDKLGEASSHCDIGENMLSRVQTVVSAAWHVGSGVVECCVYDACGSLLLIV